MRQVRPAATPGRRTHRSTRKNSALGLLGTNEVGQRLSAKTIALVRQQPALDIDRVALGHTHEAAQRPSTADDTVTGNDKRDRIGAARAADRPRCAAELARDLAVSARLADRNRRQRVPDAAPKRGARGG